MNTFILDFETTGLNPYHNEIIEVAIKKYKEDNIYGNRAIRSYKDKGLQAILESERIKKEILDFEQDMWNR